MKRHRVLRGLKILLFVVVASAVFGFVVERLWNWLMPAVFGWHMITFWQGLGLFVLSKILFGGFHRHGRHREHWKQHMKARWENMTPEEREKMRAGMWGRRCGRSTPSAEAQS
jgi:hypothetical protein